MSFVAGSPTMTILTDGDATYEAAAAPRLFARAGSEKHGLNT